MFCMYTTSAQSLRVELLFLTGCPISIAAIYFKMHLSNLTDLTALLIACAFDTQCRDFLKITPSPPPLASWVVSPGRRLFVAAQIFGVFAFLVGAGEVLALGAGSLEFEDGRSRIPGRAFPRACSTGRSRIPGSGCTSRRPCLGARIFPPVRPGRIWGMPHRC